MKLTLRGFLTILINALRENANQSKALKIIAALWLNLAVLDPVRYRNSDFDATALRRGVSRLMLLVISARASAVNVSLHGTRPWHPQTLSSVSSHERESPRRKAVASFCVFQTGSITLGLCTGVVVRWDFQQE